MAKHEAPTEFLVGRMVALARRMTALRVALGLSRPKAADLINEEIRKMYPTWRHVFTERELIAIENAAHRATRRPEQWKEYFARGVGTHLFYPVARAYQVRVVDLFESEELPGPISFDPTVDPAYAKRFLGLLNQHGKSADEMIGWGEVLPCSLEPRDFMHAHHAALFAEVPGAPEEERQQLIQVYDDVGNARRELVIDRAASRCWRFTHIMFDTDVKRIAYGEDIYGHVSARLRFNCLQHVAKLTTDPTAKVQLVVVRETPPLRTSVGSYDSRIALGSSFAFWRDRWGTLQWSEDGKKVARVREALRDLLNRPLCAGPVETAQFLTDLAGAVPL